MSRGWWIAIAVVVVLGGAVAIYAAVTSTRTAAPSGLMGAQSEGGADATGIIGALGGAVTGIIGAIDSAVSGGEDDSSPEEAT